MGKREVRRIVIPKLVSLALLGVVTALMVGVVYLLSGRAYASESHAFGALLMRRPMTPDVRLAGVMPLVAGVLFFLPWGFLLFLVLDGPSRPRRLSFAIVAAAALVFAFAIQIWQLALPSRITTGFDAIAHAAGAVCGAALAQMRKDVRVRFEF